MTTLLLDHDERLAQLASDMVFASSLATAITAAGGGYHRAGVITDGSSWRARCACKWESALECSATDAYTALFIEHLEGVALQAGVDFELP